MKTIVHYVSAMALLLCVATAGFADVRTLEAVGTVPISPTGQTAVVPRDGAVEAALREAVTRVAQEFMADRVFEEITDEEVDAQLIGGGPDGEAPDEPNELDRILGDRMVPYTTRFRVIEDRGRRPALFADDPSVREEYVVIVEVQVDAARVRSRLVETGMIPAGEEASVANEVLLEIEGLTRYRAYLDFRQLLVGPLEAKGVIAIEMSRGHTILDVETEVTAVEFLERLLTVAPAHIEIVPTHAGGNRVHVVVTWSPPTEAEGTGNRDLKPGGARADTPADL
ncbi:MAG: hypothetical protein GY944_04195 [bacterium]|nr:hypothetical protein [bacterium]